MSIAEVFILAIALALDAFSVGAVLGLTYSQPRQLFRIAWHFGLFQAVMPLLGVLLGELTLGYMAGWDKVIACAILVAMGGKMLWSARHGGGSALGEARPRHDLTRGWRMLGLSLAVSIDAFGSGISLVVAQAPLVQSVVLIGLVTILATLLAMLGAQRLGRFAGGKLEALGGAALIGIGVKILLT